MNDKADARRWTNDLGKVRWQPMYDDGRGTIKVMVYDRGSRWERVASRANDTVNPPILVRSQEKAIRMAQRELDTIFGRTPVQIAEAERRFFLSEYKEPNRKGIRHEVSCLNDEPGVTVCICNPQRKET